MEKKINVVFTIERDSESGLVGAVPVKFAGVWESYTPSFRMSHEIIDHRNGEFGAIYQELEALGAIVYLRGWTIDEGYYAGNCRSEFIASDCTSIHRDASNLYDEKLFEFPVYGRVSLSSEEKENFKALFSRLRTRLAELWASEVNQDCENDDVNDTHENCDFCSENFFFENWENVKSALMFGYKNAKKRWEGLNHQSLRANLDRAFKEKESALENYEGTGVRFSVRCEVGEYYSNAEIVCLSRYEYI